MALRKKSPDKPKTASSNPRQQPFSRGIYTAMILGVLLPTGRCAYDSIKSRINPDSRDPQEMARDTLELRRIVTPGSTGQVSDAMVEKKAEEAACLLKLMGFWDENNSTVKKPVELVIKANDPAKPYSYLPHLFHHVGKQYWSDYANKIWQLSRDKHWASQFGWLYEDFKAKYPKPEGLKGKEATKWEVEAWEKFFTDYKADQPLECPRWQNGGCVKTWEGLTLEQMRELREARKKGDEATVRSIRSKARDCLLTRDNARTVTLANAMMYADGKGEIEPMTCYRNNLHQALLAVSIPPDGGCKLVSNPRGDVQNPGTSFHGLGAAMDVANREASEPYLSIAGGWQCAFVGAKLGALGRFMGWGNDLDHCSVGERGPSKEAAAYKANVERKILPGGTARDIWERAKKRVRGR